MNGAVELLPAASSGSATRPSPSQSHKEKLEVEED